jgi:Ala-tRNA(Pro) deacylase
MCNTKRTLAALEHRSITYEYMEHPAVMNMEELRLQNIHSRGITLKNLFLRDDKGTKSFMLSCLPDARADLAGLAATLGVKRLSFGSAQRLMRCTGLSPGAVSPLGLLFDTERAVTMVFDKALQDLQERVGVHPCENTATVFLPFGELVRLIQEVGAQVIFVDI